MKTVSLIKAHFKRALIEMRRYWFDTLSGLITIYIFFLIVFFGAKAFGGGGPSFGATLSGIVVGYMVWALGLFAYSSLAQELVQEAQLGTLEQLALSRFGLGNVLIWQVLVGIVFQLFWLYVLLVFMMASTGKWLHIDVVSVLPITILISIGVLGIGFVAAGLAIVFKRVQSFLQVLQIGLIALVVAPESKFHFIKYLPLSWGNKLLARVMIKGTSIFEMPRGDVLFLVAHAVLYFLGGYIVFRYFESVARSKGLLGHY